MRAWASWLCFPFALEGILLIHACLNRKLTLTGFEYQVKAFYRNQVPKLTNAIPLNADARKYASLSFWIR